MLSCVWPGSIKARLASREVANFFFQPVKLDFELSNLLVEFSLQGFMFALVMVAIGTKKPWQLIVEVLFPLANLRGMDAKATREFIDRLVTFERLEGHPGFEFCTVTSALCRHQEGSFLHSQGTPILYLNDLSSFWGTL